MTETTRTAGASETTSTGGTSATTTATGAGASTTATAATATAGPAGAASAQHLETIEQYLRFWNAADPEDQQRLASAVFADDVEYCALIGALSGAPALIDFRDRFAEHMGAYVFRSRRTPEVHHGRARLLWQLDTHGAEPFATGTEVIVFGADGRITTITGFLDQAPEGFDPNAHD